VLGLVNDWVRMWLGYVLQQVWLHGRDPFGVLRGQRQRCVLVRIWQVGCSVAIDSGSFIRKIWVVGSGGTGNLFCYKRWGINSGGGLGEVGNVGVGVIRWLQICYPQMAKEKGWNDC
jgi:hypothetical protein